MDNLENFHKDLTVLLSKYKINLTEIPDFLIAEYMINSIVILNQTLLKNKQIEVKKSPILVV